MIRILENILPYKYEILTLIVILAQAAFFPILLRRMVKKRMHPLEEANKELQEYLSGRVKLESELLDSWAFMKSVINAISDHINVRDSNSNFVLTNEAYCRLVGRDHNEFRLDEIYPKEDAAVISQLDSLILESGNEVIFEERIVDATGHGRIFLVKKCVFVDGAGNSFIIGIRRETTEQRKMEEELRTIHHELEYKVSQRTAELRNTNLNLNREIMERRSMEKILKTQLRYERALSDSLKDLLPRYPSVSSLEIVMGHLREASGAMRVLAPVRRSWLGVPSSVRST